jgi:predicted PurR-regulated permease PerM
MSPRNRVEIGLSGHTLACLLAAGALVALVVLSLGTLVSILVAGVVALGLDPVVGHLVRRGWRRTTAAIAVFGGLFVAVAGIVVVAAGPVWHEITRFVAEAPRYWDELTHTPAFERLAGGAGDHKVQTALEHVAGSLPRAATTLLGAAGGLFGSFLSLVTLTFVALFFLIERPAMTDRLFGLTPPAVERRWRPVVEECIRAVSSSLLGNLAVSFVAATVTGVSAWALGLPFPVVLAVITGLLDLIPQVGATIAAVLLVAAGLTVGLPAAVGMLAVQLVYQQVENYVVYPLVYRRAVRLSSFTTVVAVLVAASLLGVVGAILAVPLAAVVKIVVREATVPRRARMRALRETGAAAPAPVRRAA